MSAEGIAKWLFSFIKLLISTIFLMTVAFPLKAIVMGTKRLLNPAGVKKAQAIKDRYAELVGQCLALLATKINKGPKPEARRVKLPKSGMEMHTILAGPEEGKMVVLLHGFPENFWCWHHLIPELANAGYRVVAPDVRGNGFSSRPQSVGAYRLDRIAADIDELILALGAERAHAVVGHDWGGCVAWTVASLFPYRVNKLFTINGPHPVNFLNYIFLHPTQLLRSMYMTWFSMPYLPELAHGTDTMDFMNDISSTAIQKNCFTQFDKDVMAAARAQPGAMTGGFNYYRAIPWGLPLLGKFLKPMDTPTLIIWGTEDHALEIGIVQKLKSKLVPKLQDIVAIPKCGHWVPSEAPEVVNSSVVKFLAQD